MSIMLVAMANALLVPSWSVSLSAGAAPRIGLAGVGVRRDRFLANCLRTSAKRQKRTFLNVGFVRGASFSAILSRTRVTIFPKKYTSYLEPQRER